MMLLSACRAGEQHDDDEEEITDTTNRVQLTIHLNDAEGEPISPAGLYLYDASSVTERSPLQTATESEPGTIRIEAERGKPLRIRVHTAWHRPLTLFIPPYHSDHFSVTVTPEPLYAAENPQPKVIGTFNQYDPFSAVLMELNSDGLWEAEITAESDTIRYLVDDFTHAFQIHGTDGEIRTSDHHVSNQQGLESKLMRDNSGPFHITLDPNAFQDRGTGHTLSFGEEVPVRAAGVAAIYAEMRRQLNSEENRFEAYSARLDSIAQQYDHDDVELAAEIARVPFISQLGLDEDWAEALLNRTAPGSDLWLLHREAIGELFSHSTRSEPVSQNIWDIYRQHPEDAIRGEALFNLLKFHYDRGEDEEWYQAHFDLVRLFPDHPRINESYGRGYAPESVVFLGEVFPDLGFERADGKGDIFPAQVDAELKLIWFWTFSDPDLDQHMRQLLEITEAFNPDEITVIPVALDEDRDRVLRFAEWLGAGWPFADESFASPVVQVSGITETPHILLLNRENRVIRSDPSIFEEEDIKERIERYFRTGE